MRERNGIIQSTMYLLYTLSIYYLEYVPSYLGKVKNLASHKMIPKPWIHLRIFFLLSDSLYLYTVHLPLLQKFSSICTKHFKPVDLGKIRLVEFLLNLVSLNQKTFLVLASKCCNWNSSIQKVKCWQIDLSWAIISLSDDFFCSDFNGQ